MWKQTVTEKVIKKVKTNRRRNPGLTVGPMVRVPTPAPSVITRLRAIRTTPPSRILWVEVLKDVFGWSLMLLLDGVG